MYTMGLMKLTRSAHLHDVAIRADDGDTATPMFRGHAAVFGTPTLIGTTRHGFVEQIARGAFANVLNNDVRLLAEHNPPPMARTANGTLRLTEDAEGLLVEADLADTQQARDQITLLERGDLSDMSFAFTVASETRTTYEGDVAEWRNLPMFTIDKVDTLYDVSVVSFPAYGGTDAGMRSCAATDEEIEHRLGVLNEAKILPRPKPAFRRALVPRRPGGFLS